jgi:hypothetical protein
LFQQFNDLCFRAFLFQQLNGRVWQLRQIHYSKLTQVDWRNWHEVENDQHHIITPHCSYFLGNSLLTEQT